MRDVSCSTMMGGLRCGRKAVSWDKEGRRFCRIHSTRDRGLVRRVGVVSGDHSKGATFKKW